MGDVHVFQIAQNEHVPAYSDPNDRQQHQWELKMVARFPSQRLACEDEKDGARDVFELDFETQTLAFRPLSKDTSDPLRSSNTERVRAIHCAPRLNDGKHIRAKSTMLSRPAAKRSGEVRPSIDRYLSGKYEHKRSRSDWSLQS